MRSWSCFPEGIIEDILLKLPTKSIIRFKCVSKSWFNLIKSRNFVNKNLLICEESYFVMFFTVRETLYRDPKFLLINLLNETSHPHSQFQEGDNTSPFLNFEFQFSKYGIFIRLLGQCNGIMCLRTYSKTILLINPLLKEVKTIPVSDVDNSVTCLELVGNVDNSVTCLELVGIGYDKETMDFKVVRIVGLDTSTHACNEGFLYQKAEVYRLRTNSWNELNEFPLLTDYPRLGTAVSTFFDGAVHWCAKTEYLDTRMLTFNMTTELFEHVEFPEDWNNDGRPYCKDNAPALFVMITECLAFVSYCTLFYPDHIVNIWTMDKNGNEVVWTKLYSIGPLSELVSPIGFLNKYELMYSSRDQLVLYDLLNHQRHSLLSHVDSYFNPNDSHDLVSDWLKDFADQV